MEINGLSNFNSISEFTKLSSQNGLVLGKFNNITDGQFLEGHITFDMPQMSDLKIDNETLNDLKALNIDKVASSNDVKSADHLYKSFSAALDDGIKNVNNLQRNADDAVEYFASGGNIDIHSVMIASQKARLGLEMATQMRNKIISAYKEITRMSF